MWTNFTYFFKRKYQQIQRIIDFLPIIWNGFDFDYHYSIQLFKKQLERQAKFLESDEPYSSDAKHQASRIRTAIQLIDNVYNDTYDIEWIGKLEEQFSKEVVDWEFEDTGDGTGSVYLKYKYEKWDNAEEVKAVKMTLVKLSREKQKRAEKLLWNYIGHNIRNWWD